jgi:hypothetical protein
MTIGEERAGRSSGICCAGCSINQRIVSRGQHSNQLQPTISAADQQEINIEIGALELYVSNEQAGKIVAKGVRSGDGRKVIISTIRQGRLNREL